MCGILGYVCIAGGALPSRYALEQGLMRLARRGPDDAGIWQDEHALFGHRRLSILDLSASGHQPMVSADGRYVIAYNGEVYNFRQLRTSLEEQGVRFRSQCDTEVLLELYARVGPAAMERLRGMFALAIWDMQERELFLARDRLGIKPLYVWQGAAGIAFSSEVNALRPLVPQAMVANRQGIFDFLLWGSVPAPTTVLQDVRSISAGTWVRWKEGKTFEHRFWSIPIGTYAYGRREEALESLRPTLRDAVALRCISDVPVGAFLSGGIDSSAVVGLMRDAKQRDLRTFSVSFPGSHLDESGFAAEVARDFGTTHVAAPAPSELAEEALDDFFDVMDQPTCDGLNVYLVSRLAKQAGLTVALSGIGGDEIFGGYPTFERARFTEKWIDRLSPTVRHGAALVASRTLPRLAKLEAYALPGRTQAQSYFVSRGLFAPHQAKHMLHEAWREGINVGTCVRAESGEQASSFHTAMQFELSHYMHNQLLRDADVFGLAHGLEIRVPLIDHLVVEILAKTNPAFITAGGQKALLRDALPTPLPRSIFDRPKMGFTFPFSEWVRTSWRERIQSKLLGPSSILRLRPRQRVWDDFLRGRVHWSRPWSLYVLLRWAEKNQIA